MARVEKVEYDDVTVHLNKEEAEGLLTLLYTGVCGGALRDLDLESLTNGLLGEDVAFARPAWGCYAQLDKYWSDSWHRYV